MNDDEEWISVIPCHKAVSCLRQLGVDGPQRPRQQLVPPVHQTIPLDGLGGDTALQVPELLLDLGLLPHGLQVPL